MAAVKKVDFISQSASSGCFVTVLEYLRKHDRENQIFVHEETQIGKYYRLLSKLLVMI